MKIFTRNLHKSGLLRAAHSRNPHPYSQSGVSAFLLIRFARPISTNSLMRAWLFRGCRTGFYSLHPKQLHESQTDLRNKSADKECDKQRQDQRQGDLYDLVHTEACHRHGNEHVRGNRRRYECDAECQRHDNAEVNRINAYGLYNCQKDRGQDASRKASSVRTYRQWSGSGIPASG